MKTSDQLAELTLSTIRIDARCRVMHYLDSGIKSENYRIDQECTEPDPFVQDLNTNLIACDDAIVGVLPETERRFIFDGLGGLVEHLLVSNSRLIRFANDLGIRLCTAPELEDYHWPSRRFGASPSSDVL